MLCKHCNTETNNAKFCSRSCSTTYRNKQKPKKHCQVCDKQLDNTIKRQDKYCSKECYGQATRQETFNKFINGELKFHSTIKPLVQERDGNCCALCGISTWQGQPLCCILDHIDGNSDNNKPDNLRLVCPNCDSQLPTYKGRNKGKGRHTRRQRYANGQSY